MMNKYHDVEVIINNKRYTISGYEGEEYLQKIASYINGKHNEFKNREAYKFLDADLKNILIQINIADDYYKTRDKIKEFETDNDSKVKEIFDLSMKSLQPRQSLTPPRKSLRIYARSCMKRRKKSSGWKQN
jgi:cell division protein ZapA